MWDLAVKPKSDLIYVGYSCIYPKGVLYKGSSCKYLGGIFLKGLVGFPSVI